MQIYALINPIDKFRDTYRIAKSGIVVQHYWATTASNLARTLEAGPKLTQMWKLLILSRTDGDAELKLSESHRQL